MQTVKAGRRSARRPGTCRSAACSPAAIERIEAIDASGRWTPASLDLKIALDNSRLDQTYNTPALATLFLLEDQIRWMLDQGGLAWCAERTATSSAILYEWAGARPWATPFVTDPAKRSAVVGTIDLEGVDAGAVGAALRANGIVDTEAYRRSAATSCGSACSRPSCRATSRRLTVCIDYVVEHLSS